MGSKRLPGKVLADIHGRPMLDRLLSRVWAVKNIDHIVVAISDAPADDVLEDWLRRNAIDCFRGSEADVLDRFQACSTCHPSEFIVRITADDPLKDPDIISKSIEIIHENSEIDYCSNTIVPTYPEGLDIEVFRRSALVKAHENAKLPSEREHVTPYIWKRPHEFTLVNFKHSRNLSSWRWTVDNEADLKLVRAIYGKFLDEPLVSFPSIANYVQSNEYLIEINSATLRNEGYIMSVKSEID